MPVKIIIIIIIIITYLSKAQHHTVHGTDDKYVTVIIGNWYEQNGTKEQYWQKSNTFGTKTK